MSKSPGRTITILTYDSFFFLVNNNNDIEDNNKFTGTACGRLRRNYALIVYAQHSLHRRCINEEERERQLHDRPVCYTIARAVNPIAPLTQSCVTLALLEYCNRS